MTAKTKTAVLIHGCHLQSKLVIDEATGQALTWDDLVIGSLDSKLGAGRATYGVLLAWREEAETIIFSTGASQKNGVLEAKYTYNMVRAMEDWFARRLETTVPDFAEWLEARVHLDDRSQNTQEELARNMRFVYERGHRKIILVTNRFHAPRAGSNAADVRYQLDLGDLDIHVAFPDDGTPAPVIFEPPSRGDRPTLDLRPVMGKIFKVPPNRLSDFMASLNGQLNGLLGEH